MAEQPTRLAVSDEEAVARFCELLKIRTIWPRDGKIDCLGFERFFPTLKEQYPRALAAMDYIPINQYGILLRWNGTDKTKRPVLFMGHYDTVDADEEAWTYPPFGAEIHDGRIYARGTIDNKLVIAAFLEAVEALLAEGFTPERDIYFWSTNNEESSGPSSPACTKWLQDHNVDLWFVLDEGGAIVDEPALGIKHNIATVGVSERGNCDVRVVAHGPGGHASTPSKEDAPVRLLEAVRRIEKHQFRPRIPKETAIMLQTIVSYGPKAYQFLFNNLWLFRPLITAVLAAGKETNSMVRTTMGLTKLKGSDAINIIPEEASASFSTRVLPGDSVEGVLKHIRKSIGRKLGKHVDVELEYGFEPSPISDYTSDAWNLISDAILDVYPDTGVTPYIMSGCSDCKHFSLIYKNAYRFYGFLLGGDDRSRMHGNDENIPVDAYLNGVQFYIRMLRRIQAADAE